MLGASCVAQKTQYLAPSGFRCRQVGQAGPVIGAFEMTY
jgi:hypothetical protein